MLLGRMEGGWEVCLPFSKREKGEQAEATEEPGDSSGEPVLRVCNRTLRKFIALTICTELHIFNNKAKC